MTPPTIEMMSVFQIERSGGQWDKGKGCETFGPIGPWFVTRDEIKDPQNLDMWLDVNGERCQRGNTRMMSFGCEHLVWYCSQFFVMEPGDIIITFQVQPDRFFRRDGLDLISEVPINLAQAVLGSRIRVRTIDGKKVVLRIPPGTQPGRRFRIRGQGVEKNGRRGDQLVQVDVTVPENLSSEQQDLVRKLAESAGLKY